MTWLARALAGSLVLVFFASSASAAPPPEGEATSQSIVEIDVERREVLYVAGMRIPKDAVVVKRRRWGLVGTGATLFFVPYFSTLGFWSSDPYYSSGPTPATVHIPVVGPFVVAAQGTGSDDHAPGRAVGIPVSGVFQLAGVTMLVLARF